MRRTSLLVPLGGVVATAGIFLPMVQVAVRLPGARIPVVSALVEAIPEQSFGASADQRLYLLVVLALAVAGWLVPRLAPRTSMIGFGLSIGAATIATLGTCRGWLIISNGPHALVKGDSSFLEQNALTFADRLHSDGVLVIDPAAGLWTLTAGSALLLVGAVLPVLPRPRNGRG